MRRIRKFCGELLVLGSLAMLLIAGILYGPTITGYVKSYAEYREISGEYTEKPKKSEEKTGEMIPGLPMDKYGCIAVDTEGLKKENRDYLGWIYIPGTAISYPVVKSRDNDDYLHKDFHRQYSFPGTVFMDCRNLGEYDFHTILYGHNMRNGTMFANLRKFTDQSYAEEHPVFWFINDRGQMYLYRIFACCEASYRDSYYYGVVNWDGFGYEDWKNGIPQTIEDSQVNFSYRPESLTRVMTLSTCTGNACTRYVVSGALTGMWDGEKFYEWE